MISPLTKEHLNKKISWWITYPVLIVFSLVVFGTASYFFMPKALSAVFPRPYEGSITHIEYNCLCSGSIMLTIRPNTESGLANQGPTLVIMYYWAAEILSRILDLEVLGIPLGPRIYEFYQIFYTSNAKLLGLYYPMRVPCVAYAGTACSITGYAQGVLITTGTSIPTGR